MSKANAKNPSNERRAKALDHDYGTDFFDKIETFLGDKRKVILIINLALTALLGLLLFDGRLSFATDDATYIQNAIALLERGSYPSFQGPLYPYFLALIIKLFGVKVLLFKTFSLIFLIGHNFFLYKALQNRVPWLMLFGGLFVSAVNAYILAYGSSTFSEAFYMLMQALSIYVFFNLIDKVSAKGNEFQLKDTIKEWLLFGLVFFLLSISKNVALFAIGAVVVFFLLRKEWRNAIIAPLAFALFKIPYEIFVRMVWGKVGGDQAELLLRKDFHDPSKGVVGLGDLIERFFENFGNYISVHVFKVLGLRGSGISSIFTFEKIKELRDPSLIMEASVIYSLLFVILFGLGLFYAFKRNKYVFYLLLYVTALTSVTFTALHTFWNQDRLIVIYIPIIFIGLCYGLYGFIRHKDVSALKPALPILMAVVILIQLVGSLKVTSKNSKQFSGYTKGNEYAGYPLSVANYLKMAKWTGKNINDSLRIACNKPIEATAFGGAIKYTKMPQITNSTPDSILNMLKGKNIGYVILDNFGADLSPAIQAIYQKYPEKIEQMHQEGEMEPAYLIKVSY